MQPSLRSAIEPFRAMQVVENAEKIIQTGGDVIMMCVGQPGAPAPTTAREAAQRAIERGKIGYTNAKGISPLRHRIARYYQDKYGVSPDPERIFVTTGSSAGFILSFLACFEVGARVAIPAPGYPAYRNILKTLSLVPVEISTREESGWVVSPELLEAAQLDGPLDGILLANPNNPNGTMLSETDFRATLAYCSAEGIKFLSDEIYHGLTYTKPEITALALSDETFVINSFSKYFCMTGWRIGWMVVPETMIESVNRLQQNAFICAPEVSQIAALAAFEGLEEMETVKQGYITNRELVAAALPKLGIKTIQPMDGAFYAYAEISPWLQATGYNGSVQLADAILQEAHVALTPGIDFDAGRGEAWMRFSFAGTLQDMERGFDRLQTWLDRF